MRTRCIIGFESSYAYWAIKRRP